MSAAWINLIIAAGFISCGVMMYRLFRRISKHFPHAYQVAIMYAICFGAMTLSALLDVLAALIGRSILLSVLLLVASACGFSFALLAPGAMAVWMVREQLGHTAPHKRRA